MTDAQAFHALIRGERRGCLAGSARCGLAFASLFFRAGAGLRALGYDRGLLRAHAAGIPVISVGNLTAGGTGKTPLVIHLARALQAQGEKVAVLARGYGAARDGLLNDELRLVTESVPEALVVPGRDRVARAAEAVAQGATVALLDDGFQHRRLSRDLDIVLLDATEPWGHPPGALLPRGLLREPARALRRAHVVVLSRVELCGEGELAALEAEVRAAGFTGPVLRLQVRPACLELLALADGSEDPGGDLAQLTDLPLLAACGIGNPAAFAATLARQRARTSQLVALPDHHSYSPWDVQHLEKQARERAVTRIVVTAKDAVKLRGLLEGPRGVTWQALGIEVDLEPAGAMSELLERLKLHKDQGVG